MIDQKKVILMAKMSMYEKRQLRSDKRKINYFIEDYIYINNFKIRLGISAVMIIIAFVGAVIQFSNTLVFPTSLQQVIEEYLMVYFKPWIVLMITYTFISTMVYRKKHNEASKRYKKYMTLKKRLDDEERNSANKEGEMYELH